MDNLQIRQEIKEEGVMKTEVLDVRRCYHAAATAGPSTWTEEPSKVSIRKILVPLDLLDGSAAVFGFAMALAGRFQAELVLLHVFEPVAPSLKIFESIYTEAGFRQEAADELAEWRSRVPPEFNCTAVLREGKHAHHEILDLAKQYNVDLIVIGKTRRAGLERALLGSTADQVIKKARCPVLVTN